MRMRMKNPAMIFPDAMKGIQNLLKATSQGGAAQQTMELIGLRVSQINGCGVCVQGHLIQAKKTGETDERIAAVAAWRDSPYFTDAERAALALSEAITRLADRSGEAVPDDIWDEAVKYHDERQLAAVILMISTLNLFNRINVTVKEQADNPSWA